VAEITTKHLTNEELDVAIKEGTAKIVCSRPKWQLVVHGGLKYSCVSSTVTVWARAVGCRASDYRGTETRWMIKSVEPDLRYERIRPRQAMPIDELIPQLKKAITYAANGSWNKPDWPLLKPENIQALIDEIERSQMSKAA
jgi:hypothetical protein